MKPPPFHPDKDKNLDLLARTLVDHAGADEGRELAFSFITHAAVFMDNERFAVILGIALDFMQQRRQNKTNAAQVPQRFPWEN
jgi:hypothetical protein